MRGKPVAAIDCGTNSTRLLIVRGGEVLIRSMQVTRLGQGVDATQQLAPGAIERTLAVLTRYRSDMDRLKVVAARLVATSAVRDAANGKEFLRQAGAIVGVGAELLSGEEEGRLSYQGATVGLPPAPGVTVVVDIGADPRSSRSRWTASSALGQWISGVCVLPSGSSFTIHPSRSK